MTREVFLLILATASEDPSVNCERLWYKILTASRASRTKVLVNGYSFCVRIRSANGLVCHDLAIRFYAGGGIVADSELDKEHSETLDKASSMLALIQRFGGDVSLTDNKA